MLADGLPGAAAGDDSFEGVEPMGMLTGIYFRVDQHLPINRIAFKINCSVINTYVYVHTYI